MEGGEMVERRRITENLDIDLEKEVWCCNACGMELISARENYKRGCLLYERDPRTLYDPAVIKTSRGFAPDHTWMAIVEFYCPRCGVMIETEPLPLGHPVTHDIELDIDALKRKASQSEEKG